MKKEPSSFVLALFFVLLFAHAAVAQNTSFSFQGRLQSGGNPASGSHDFEFALFDTVAGGSQLGATVSVNNVVVTDGIFSVQLDFGNQFPGANRFLEIRVRPSGQPGMTALAPRQPLNSTPYSVKSLTAETAINATQLGGVAAGQFVVTTDPRMSDARTPTPGSGDYIQNRSVTQQPATNFNISGNGTLGGRLMADVVNASTHFELGNGRILHYTVSSNLYLGFNTGANHTTGSSNSFFGTGAGLGTSSGSNNSFFGTSTGALNSTGGNNSFFGARAGGTNSSGNDNSFFGAAAGFFNVGSANSFFGRNAGVQNTTGTTNSFFGYNSGVQNTIGQNNAFFGANAGAANTTALGNSFFGANAGAANVTAMGNSFFGASAGLVNTGANNSFFGTVAGVANTTGFNNAFFGYWAGHDNSNGDNNAFFGRSAGEINSTGNGNTFVGANAGDANTTGSNNTTLGNGADVGGSDAISFGTAIGAGSVVTSSNSVVLGRATDNVHVPGSLAVIGTFHVLADALFFEPVILTELGSAGNLPLCRNSDEEISTCSSSGRYKTNIATFASGLDLISRLRPVSFDWKNGGMHDLGLVAEEVAEVEPLLTTTNSKGEIEGVKYDRVGVVLVNAVKEQQAQIESQRREIDELRTQLDALRKLLCSSNPTACEK